MYFSCWLCFINSQLANQCMAHNSHCCQRVHPFKSMRCCMGPAMHAAHVAQRVLLARRPAKVKSAKRAHQLSQPRTMISAAVGGYPAQVCREHVQKPPAIVALRASHPTAHLLQCVVRCRHATLMQCRLFLTPQPAMALARICDADGVSAHGPAAAAAPAAPRTGWAGCGGCARTTRCGTCRAAAQQGARVGTAASDMYGGQG